MGVIYTDERRRGTDTGISLYMFSFIGGDRADRRENTATKEILLCVLSNTYIDSTCDKPYYVKGAGIMDNEKELIIMTLMDAEGNPYDATLLTTFQAGEEKQDYAAFMSHIPDSDGVLPIQIFRYKLTVRDGQEGMEIDNIRSDLEFEKAYNALLPLIEAEN